jgi:hypothetical protein
VKKKTTETIVFLLDNDTAQADYVAEIRRTVSPQTAQPYWENFQNLTKELGYADYLGALQQYRLQDQHDPKLLSVASYLLDYDFTAQHYVIVDDKLRLLAAIKQHWRKRVTTVFVRQGHYAADPMTLADYPPADITLERIDELLNYEPDDFLNASNTV